MLQFKIAFYMQNRQRDRDKSGLEIEVLTNELEQLQLQINTSSTCVEVLGLKAEALLKNPRLE